MGLWVQDFICDVPTSRCWDIMIPVYSQTNLAFSSCPGVDNKCHPLYICSQLGLIPRFSHCTSWTEIIDLRKMLQGSRKSEFR